MNLRRLVASVSLDAGAYVRDLEDTLRQLARKHDQALEREARLGELNDANAVRLMEAAQQIQTLESEHDALANDLAMVRARRDVLRARVTELEAEVAYQTTRARDLEAEAATQRLALDEAAQTLESEAAAHAREMIEMRGALNEANARIDELLRGGQIQLLSVEVEPAPPPVKPEVVSDTVQRRVYQVVKLALQGGYKWYFTDGGSESFNAAILDEEFVTRMNRREIFFAHGDALEVDVHIVSTRAGKQFTTKYEFVKVIRHLVPDQQPTFPFNAPAEPGSASEGVTS